LEAGIVFDLLLTSSEATFRDEVRAYIRAHVPADVATRMLAGFHATKEEMLSWTAALYQRGWSVPAWPRKYGGPGWTPYQQYIFEVECVTGGAPYNSGQGVDLIGPILYTFGTEAQKERYLQPIIRGEELWGQCFSEPSSGSDLASLKTRAESRGDHWVINGQKIWTTDGHLADMLYCLVRTNLAPKPQKGISIILLDPKSKGVRIRPIISIDGTHSLNEIFFDEVEVPLNNLIGEEGQGWTYAKLLLENERPKAAEVPRMRRDFIRLVALSRAHTRSREFLQRLSWCEAEIMALEAMTLRALEEQGLKVKDVWPAGNILKMRGALLHQRLADLQIEVIGRSALQHFSTERGSPTPASDSIAAGAGVVGSALYRRADTIYGGTNEIQHDIIARYVLTR
jgi:alkylation response protein AidB-like acyl-CoA dehydrogenase